MSLLDSIKFGKPLFDEVCSKAKNEYSVEQSISGYYRLYKNGKLVHDDSACEDVQEEESAYSFFAEYVKEYDLEKDLESLTIEDCFGALVNFGGDPSLVETDEQAEELFNFLTQDGCECKPIVDEDDFEVAMGRLDLCADNNVKVIYDCGCWNQEHAEVCFSEHWDFA